MSRKRIRNRYAMQLEAMPEHIFPLLCPVREYDWIQVWGCEMVYSESGRAELDCVFKTSFADDGPEDTWLVSRYEPPRYIEFVRINPLRSIRYGIELIPVGTGITEAVWQQVVTALSSSGDDFVAGLSEEAFAVEMGTLQQLLSHYLQYGTAKDMLDLSNS